MINVSFHLALEATTTSFEPSDVHPNSYLHRDTGEGGGPLPGVFDLLQYLKTISP